ncbi:MAG: hypothetical protein ABUL77_04580 [Bacteroidota bacterium]
MSKSPSNGSPAPGGPGGEAREAELIAFPRRRTGAPQRPPTDHLLANRGLIVRRSLLATAVGGVVPIPVMDDYLAGRVRAGLLMRIADRRRVDLAPSSADLVADPREGTAARNATITAATFLALKLAWRKFFLVLGAARRAEEMATTFQVATLFDHFCAKLHVGAGTDRAVAVRIRAAAFAAIHESERAAVVGIFQDGGRVLSRSISEAPAWASRQLHRVIEQYVASGGNPDAVPGAPAGADQQSANAPDADDDRDLESAVDPDARWLDRAASLVEEKLGRLGNPYLESLLTRFEHHFAQTQPPAPAAGTEAPGGGATGVSGPPADTGGSGGGDSSG